MPKMMKNEKILSFWFVLILIVLSMIRTQNIDVFIGFVVPWVAYSNTIEIVGK